MDGKGNQMKHLPYSLLIPMCLMFSVAHADPAEAPKRSPDRCFSGATPGSWSDSNDHLSVTFVAVRLWNGSPSIIQVNTSRFMSQPGKGFNTLHHDWGPSSTPSTGKGGWSTPEAFSASGEDEMTGETRTTHLKKTGNLWSVTTDISEVVSNYLHGFVKERPCNLLDKQASGPGD